MPSTPSLVTRFAPTPTGALHIGHAYAALRAWQQANADASRFVLRIEDLDSGRCRSEFVESIFEDLSWLGLRWREPVLFQSSRAAAYGAALATLSQRGLIYPCFCTRASIATALAGGPLAHDIARAGAAPHASEQAAPLYPGTCRDLGASERALRIARGEPYAMRLDAALAAQQPEAGDLYFVEQGDPVARAPTRIEVQTARWGDVVLARKDLPAAYHLAVVLDDAFQQISLVTRGEDLREATHVQRLLQALLNLPAPRYAHHRLILDAHGRKFSKRDQAPTLRSLRAAGSTPAALTAQLGL
jgi:glutamyl-Q tRNA(Asp) synthetase